MAAVLAAASYSRIGFSLYVSVRALRVRVPGGSKFHLQPGTIGSGGRRGILIGTPYGIKQVSAVAVHVLQSDQKINSSDDLFLPPQTANGLTQGRSSSMNATISPVGPTTTSSCGGIAAAV